MGDLLPLFVLVIVGIMAAALFDCVTTDERSVRHLPKPLWVIVILLFLGFGGILWFMVGRADTAVPTPDTSGHPAGRGRPDAGAVEGFLEPQSPRTLAPDDDPTFLADLAARNRNANLRPPEPRDPEARDANASGADTTGAATGSDARGSDARGSEIRSDEERLRKWEADLREREERLRQRGEPPTES
jgi:hypothetical protein